ncbi:MAG: copper resistance D family protein [Actinomadura sp.]
MASTDSRSAVLQRTISLPSPRRKRVMAYVAAAAVAGGVGMALAMWLGGNLVESRIDGLAIGGRGDFTGWGLPTSKLLLNVASIGVIGLLLTRLLLPENEPESSAMARRCLRTASWLALVWAASNAVLLIFTWSDMVARPVRELSFGSLFTDTARTFPEVTAYVSSTGVAMMIAVGLSISETRRGALILLPLSVYNLVPMALQGHASHSTLLKYTLIMHVIAMALWVGGLAALLTHVRREPTLLAVAVPRFSTLALACYAVVTVTGIVAAWELLQSLSLLWGSRYGVVIILKVAALIALGVFGWWHRRHTLHRIRAGEGGRSRRAFIQLAAGELVVMVLAVGLAVGLSRTASPDTILLHSSRGEASASFDQTQPGTRP